MLELVLCALIWGASFVAQKLGSEQFGPFTVICCREFLAAAFLLCCVRLRRKGEWNRATLVGGALSGLFIFAGELSQQLGVERTTPGVAAFLTTNYVLLVPVFGLGLGRKAGWGVWGGVALALAGTYLLCVGTGDGRFGVGAGEVWVLLCAVFFAVQILVVERFVRSCDMLRFSLVQVSVAGLTGLPFALMPGELARANWSGGARGVLALLFLGVVSGGIAYSLQNFGQQKVSAAAAAIILSAEGVFASIFGWLFLGDLLSARQLAGCALVLGAVVVSQVVAGRR